jgi:hypothetical protein
MFCLFLTGFGLSLSMPFSRFATCFGASQPWTNDAPTVAARINAYPRGTCTHLYLTSDGGGKIADLFDLAPLLDEHVEIVGNEIGDLALAAARAAQAR